MAEMMLDPKTLDPRAIWEASFSDVLTRLADSSSSRHKKGEFMGIARQVWPPK